MSVSNSSVPFFGLWKSFQVCIIWLIKLDFKHFQLKISRICFILLLKEFVFSNLQMWPEGTDPQKFVYEDIAIAAYLLVRSDNALEF